MSKLRMAYLLSRYPNLSEAFILREVLGLRERGVEIAVASVNPPDRPPERLTAQEREEAAGSFVLKRVGVARLLAAHATVLARSPLRYLAALASAVREADLDLRRTALWIAYFAEAVLLGRWMEEQELDHVHVHFATPAAAVALLASRVFPITYSITMHGPDELYDVSRYALRAKLESARFVCCIGLFARGQVMRLLSPGAWRKLEISRLGVDPKRFAPPERRSRAARLEVLCVGRLVPEKGQRVLLEAVAALVRRGRPVRLSFVGDGPDRAAIEARVAELGLGAVVHVVGPVNQDGIRAYYERADAFALASFAEGIPVVLMEAMSVGLPCVTTYTAGIPELVRDGVDGLLVAQSDVEGMAAALERLLDDPALRSRLGQSGRAHITERWRLDASCDRLAEIFDRRLREAPSAERETHDA